VAQLALRGKSEIVQLSAIEPLNKMQGYNESEMPQEHMERQAFVGQGWTAKLQKTAPECEHDANPRKP
jgi:hypothetical protein